MKMFEMMKQVRELKRIQKEMERKIVTSASRDGWITVEVRCDMSLKSVKIDPQAFEPGHREKLPERLVSTINNALDEAKRKAAEDMAAMTKGTGLGALLGGQS
jgi:nucleoid-associated protein EbfC